MKALGEVIETYGIPMALYTGRAKGNKIPYCKAKPDGEGELGYYMLERGEYPAPVVTKV